MSDIPSDIPDKGTDNNFAFVFACFPNDTGDSTTHPGCSMNATWPRDYGDIIWGTGNCLYDAGGVNEINNQCASATDSTVGDVLNPYYQPPSQTSSTQPTTTSNPYPLCTGVDISSLSCTQSCCGHIPCPQWCIDNCGGAGVSHC